MKKLVKNYKILQYKKLLNDYPILLFYQLNNVSYNNWLETKLKLSKLKLNYIKLKSGIAKKNLKFNFLNNAVEGPVVLIFVSSDFDFNNSNAYFMNSYLETKLFLVKINEKFYSIIDPEEVHKKRYENAALPISRRLTEYSLIFTFRNYALKNVPLILRARIRTRQDSRNNVI